MRYTKMIDSTILLDGEVRFVLRRMRSLQDGRGARNCITEYTNLYEVNTHLLSIGRLHDSIQAQVWDIFEEL